MRRIDSEAVLFAPAIINIPGDNTVAPDEHSIRQLKSNLEAFATETRKRLDEIGKRIAASQNQVVINVRREKIPTETELAVHTNGRSIDIAENNSSAYTVVETDTQDSDYQLDAIKRRLAERLRKLSHDK